MVRAISQDYILFEESLNAFRNVGERTLKIPENEPSFCYILPSFRLEKEIDLVLCKISPAKTIKLGGTFQAFPAKVTCPEWIGMFYAHLFGFFLSSLISFLTSRPCKSDTSPAIGLSPEMSSFDEFEIGLQHPIKTAGTGYQKVNFRENEHFKLEKELKFILYYLMDCELKKFRVIMQSVRLCDLSVLNVIGDFGLGYLLIVSSIESIAQEAVSVDKAEVNKKIAIWEKEVETNKNLKKLFNAYCECEKGRNQLAKRYLQFILNYAPIIKWKEYVPHPLESIYEQYDDKTWDDAQPQDFTLPHLKKIIGDTYQYRSAFVHAGTQPPHKDPIPLLNRFFQDYTEYRSENYSFTSMQKTILTYNALFWLAKNAIINWMSETESKKG